MVFFKELPELLADAIAPEREVKGDKGEEEEESVIVGEDTRIRDTANSQYIIDIIRTQKINIYVYTYVS